jgi:hypothetical protein
MHVDCSITQKKCRVFDDNSENSELFATVAHKWAAGLGLSPVVLTGTHNSNLMIGEHSRSVWEFDLGHVAADTVCLAHRAGFSWRVGTPLPMAAETRARPMNGWIPWEISLPARTVSALSIQTI